jgi:hypothetical protein
MTSIHSSELSASIWAPIINFLSQPADGDTHLDLDIETINATERIALLLNPETSQKTMPLHQFFSDLEQLDESKRLKKETIIAMIETIINKIMSGLASKSMLTALVGLIGHLVEVDSSALDDLIPDIKDAMKKAVKLIVKQLAQNPKMARQAYQLLQLIGKILGQLGMPAQTPEQLIQGVATELNIDADALKNLLSNPMASTTPLAPQDPLASINISSNALWEGSDTLIELTLPNIHAITDISIKKLEDEFGTMLDMIQ